MKPKHKKNPFRTPEGYFEALSDKVMERLSEEGEAARASKNASGFTVPDGYFENIGESIRQQLKVRGVPSDVTHPETIRSDKAKIISLHPYKKYLYAAASVAAIFLLVFSFNREASPEITFDDLAATEIEGYFEENPLDLSSYELAELVPVDELEISDILADGLEEDILLEYLDDNTETYEELRLDDNE